MNNNQTIKQKLIEYLYPTDKMMEFMCNDIYQELLKIIPLKMCISYKNTNKFVREENKVVVENTIKNFINTNNYKQQLFKFYKHENINTIAKDVLIGLVFYIANTNDKYANIDIFSSSKSICYDKTSILRFI